MMNIDQFAQANKASVATLFSFAEQAFASVEKLAALNIQVIKTSLTEASESSQAAASAKSPQELLNLQTTLVQSAPEKALAYGRQVKEILTEAAAAPRAETEAKIAEVQSKFLEAVSGVLKNAPGSENTEALFRSAVASANNAYEGANKASKQVIDAVDANITKFSETAAKATRNLRPAKFGE